MLHRPANAGPWRTIAILARSSPRKRGGGARMSTWVVLVCVAGISLTYVFRALFERWVYRRVKGLAVHDKI
jgi:hypothetical protein